MPNLAADNRALSRLAQVLASEPTQGLEHVAAELLELCPAGSAGVDVLEESAGARAFRCVAGAGQIGARRDAVVLVAASPSGAALAATRAALLVDPTREYPLLATLEPAVTEALVAPVVVRGVPVGAVWVMSHSRHATFDAGDARRLEALAAFAAAGHVLGSLARAREEEQRRLARELHDEVGQSLTALSLAIHAARSGAPLEARVARLLGDVHDAAEQAAKDVHEIAVRLRPAALDDVGLHAALHQLASSWSARARVEVDLEVSTLDGARLPSEIEATLYRVVQEALTNVNRHARARSVSVTVQRHGGYAIASVEDDGVGFDVDAAPRGRLGLLGMRERLALVGGTLSIDSGAGRGTTVIARVPLRAAAP